MPLFAAGIRLNGTPAVNTSVSIVVLLPGTYSANTPQLASNSTNATTSLLGSLLPSTPSPFDGFTSSTSTSGLSVALENDARLLFYPTPLFNGQPNIITSNRTASASSTLSFASLLMASDQYAILNVSQSSGSIRRVVVYEGVADSSHWTLGKTDTIS